MNSNIAQYAVLEMPSTLISLSNPSGATAVSTPLTATISTATASPFGLSETNTSTTSQCSLANDLNVQGNSSLPFNLDTGNENAVQQSPLSDDLDKRKRFLAKVCEKICYYYS